MKYEKIKNPMTGRWIRIGGSTYQQLVKQNIDFHLSPHKTTQSYPHKPQEPVNRHFESYPIDKESISWKMKKPQSVGQRNFISQHCGDSCFLLPISKKFPICNKTLPCEYNCRGIKAASARAGQWKYTEVLKKSKELSQKMDCYKHKKQTR